MKKSYATHNHPRDLSFSPDDIDFALAADLKQIRAVTPKRTFIADVVKPFNNGKEQRLFNNYVKTSEKQVKRDLSTKYRKGEISLEQYNSMYWDDVWKKVSSSKYGKHFKYIKIDG